MRGKRGLRPSSRSLRAHAAQWATRQLAAPAMRRRRRAVTCADARPQSSNCRRPARVDHGDRRRSRCAAAPPARAAAAPGSARCRDSPASCAISSCEIGSAAADARIEVRVEHRRQGAREARLGSEQPVVLDHADELAQPLVELRQQEAVERHAGVEQPHEGRPRHVGDRARRAARRCRSGAARPSAATLRRTSRRSRRRRSSSACLRARRCHLDQAVDDADPGLDRLALPADERCPPRRRASPSPPRRARDRTGESERAHGDARSIARDVSIGRHRMSVRFDRAAIVGATTTSAGVSPYSPVASHSKRQRRGMRAADDAASGSPVAGRRG